MFNRNRLLIYAFIISFISLFAEMHLTRLLSFKSWNHVLYVIITLALLGYGVGSTITIVRKKNPIEMIPWLIIGQSLLLVVTCFAVGALNIFNLHLQSSVLVLAVAYLITLAPFIIAGYALSIIFMNTRQGTFNVIYFADLLGATLGILMFFPAITVLGVYRSLELAALLTIAFVWLLYVKKYKPILAVVLAALAVLLCVNEDSLNIPVEPKKELGIARSVIPGEYKISFSAWYPLGKVQVIHPSGPQADLKFVSNVGFGTFMIPTTPFFPPFHYITNNGGAGTPAYNLTAEGLAKYGVKGTPFVSPMEFPFLLVDRPRTFIIGTGGGRDIYTALLHQADKVAGAEINPLIFRLMKKGFLAEYTDDIYNKPNVYIANIDGRSLVKKEIRNGKSYDLIILNGVDTFTAVSTGAFTFSESYIYTQEAVDEYVKLLGEKGVINFNRWHFPDYPRETLKLFITSAHALKNNGIAHPEKNLFYATCQDWGMLLIKKTAFTAREQAALIEYLSRFPYVTVLYQPYGGNQRNEFVNYIRTLTEEGPEGEQEFMRNALFYIVPATDDKPFYFRYYRLKDLSKIFSSRWDITPLGGYYAVFVQFFVLFISFIMIVLFIILPVATRYRRNVQVFPATMMAIYFTSIGLAYIFIEITLMQKTTILFGSPIYPMGIIMSTMLLATGIGSYAMKRCVPNVEKTTQEIIRNSIVLFSVIALFIFCADAFFGFLLAMPFILNVFIISVISMVFGFLLGAYFPAGILLWGKQGEVYVPWAYAINSGSTVISSMLVVIIAQMIGFSWLFLLSLCLYGVALWAFLKMRKLDSQPQ
jgi:hypothetical protein